MTRIRAAVALGCCLSLTLPSADDDDPAEETFTERALAEAQTYDFSIPGAEPTPFELQPTPVLKWTNPVTGSIRGRVFVWTVTGRPEVIASIYEFGDRPGISVEAHSLSTGFITVTRDDGATWAPQSPGVTLQNLDRAPVPAQTPPQRLIQMRSTARRFTVERTDADGTRRSLRLMRQPLYRYAVSDNELVDGTVFCFVQGTNPDVILLLEARGQGDERVWQYGLARMHHYGLSVQLDGEALLEFDQLPRSDLSDASKAYFIFRRGFE